MAPNALGLAPPHLRRHYRATTWDSSNTLFVLLAVLVVIAGVSTFSLLSQSTNPATAVQHRVTSPRPKVAPRAPVKPAPAPAPAKPPAVVATPVNLGVYAGPGAQATAQAFVTQNGGQVPYALDFINGTTWSEISDPQWTLQHWTGTSFHMIFAVPMLPDRGASLASGATGAYDSEFASLATNLVAAGDGNSTLMLGWDPLQPGTAWEAVTPAESTDYRTYWRDIVTTMRSVQGANFAFEWDGGNPTRDQSPSLAYPGDAYVDLVATDAFDNVVPLPDVSRWTTQAQATYGADWFSQFALSHKKPLAIAKWGLVPARVIGGGGDDPKFVTQLTNWCATHHVAMAVVWDYGIWAIDGPTFPAAASALGDQHLASSLVSGTNASGTS
jgi:hypothetical protein